MRGVAARFTRISKLRSSGSPARSNVASSRVTMVMSFWLTPRRWKSGALAGAPALAAPASSARIGMKPISCRRATAAGVLEASSTPSCTSPLGVTALYWKNAIPGSVLACHAQHFLDGGQAGERFAQPVLEHGLHAFLHRGRAQLAGGGVPHDQGAQAVGHGEHLDDADPAPVARAGAFGATDRLVQSDFARGLEAAQAHLLDHFRK